MATEPIHQRMLEEFKAARRLIAHSRKLRYIWLPINSENMERIKQMFEIECWELPPAISDLDVDSADAAHIDGLMFHMEPELYDFGTLSHIGFYETAEVKGGGKRKYFEAWKTQRNMLQRGKRW